MGQEAVLTLVKGCWQSLSVLDGVRLRSNCVVEFETGVSLTVRVLLGFCLEFDLCYRSQWHVGARAHTAMRQRSIDDAR